MTRHQHGTRLRAEELLAAAAERLAADENPVRVLGQTADQAFRFTSAVHLAALEALAYVQWEALQAIREQLSEQHTHLAEAASDKLWEVSRW